MGCQLCLQMYMRVSLPGTGPSPFLLKTGSSRSSVLLLCLHSVSFPPWDSLLLTSCLGTPHFNAPPLNNHPSLLLSLIMGSSPLCRINDFRTCLYFSSISCIFQTIIMLIFFFSSSWDCEDHTCWCPVLAIQSQHLAQGRDIIVHNRCWIVFDELWSKAQASCKL